jgi:Replication protein
MPSEQLLEDRPAPPRSEGAAPAQRAPSGPCEQVGLRHEASSLETPERRRLYAWRALHLLHRVSALNRVRNCRRVRTGQGPVEIRYRQEDARAHTAGLQTCGSVWACPLCSERILAGRADELLSAIETHRAAGGDVLLVTLTMRHNLRQALLALLNGLGEAWSSARKAGKLQRAVLAGVDWVRRVEVTYGRNGWHVHIHALLFVEAGTDPEPIGAAMFAGWRARLVSQGFEAPSDERGMKIKRLDLSDAGAAVAAYLGQDVTDRKRAAHELASSAKVARAGNRTPMQVLRDCERFGEAGDFDVWAEWEAASKGRKAITWSKGARDRLVLGVEKTDEELAQETDRGGEIVALIDPDAWREIVKRPKLVSHILQRVETEVYLVDADLFEAVSSLLDREGFAGAVCRPPPLSPRPGCH